MQAGIIVAFGLACVAIGLFAARPFIRRLYAPPGGQRRLRITWILGAVSMAASFALGTDHEIAAVAMFTSGPAIGLMATLLCRDAYNRARGLSPDYVEIPEQLDTKRRVLFLALSAGCAVTTWWLISVDGWRAAHAAWAFGGFAFGFGTAAARGRLSARMRQHLGAGHPPVELLERPANDR